MPARLELRERAHPARRSSSAVRRNAGTASSGVVSVLLEVLVDARPEELADVAAAAAELLTEALAPFHLAQRASPRETDAADPTT